MRKTQSIAPFLLVPLAAAAVASFLVLGGCSTLSTKGGGREPSSLIKHSSQAGRDVHPWEAEEIQELSSRWRLIHRTSWQRLTDPETDARAQSPSLPAPDGSVCSQPGMLKVEGKFVVGFSDFAQNEACDLFIVDQGKNRNVITQERPILAPNDGTPLRCAHFDRARLDKIMEPLHRKDMSFCIDKYEYPNIEGQNPAVMMTLYEAQDACKSQNKRLCTDEEWTFACEGEAALPYPYGYERSADACNQDKPHPNWDEDKLMHPRNGPQAAAELEYLWKGVPSGSMAACVSPFGVHDMPGNIDEWTTRKISQGDYPGAQKGGWWGPVRARCRPTTTAHGPEHIMYQQGTRCCSDH